LSKTSSQSSPAKIIPRTVSDSFVPLQNNLITHKTKSLDKGNKSNPRYKEAPRPDQMARTSSRADEDGAQQAPPVNIKTNPPVKEEDFQLSSGDSLDVDGNDAATEFPPPPVDLPVVKTEPEPTVGKVETRTPSPVKIRTAPPPPYETVGGLPSEYIRTVIATYSYVAADEDELSFTKGEHILVVHHPQPEEQVIFILKSCEEL